MINSLKLNIPKNYRQNLSREYGKKKRPLSKKLNNVNVLYNNNNIFNNKINNFSNTKNKFFPLYNKEYPMMGYPKIGHIKDNQQHLGLKLDLLNNKGFGKDKIIRQINKDNERKLDYLFKINEKKNKSQKNEFNLIDYNKNKNKIPIKKNEKGKKGKKFYLKNKEDKETLEIEDLEQKNLNQKFNDNNDLSSKYIKKNDIMIKDLMNIKENNLFNDELY